MTTSRGHNIFCTSRGFGLRKEAIQNGIWARDNFGKQHREALSNCASKSPLCNFTTRRNIAVSTGQKRHVRIMGDKVLYRRFQ
ncbi:MAG: hypothetical protein P8J02_13935 [Yoonia sp.]|nr:hypothetical protein [Yoonia sp.]